jgi:SsrA-binding protein
MAKKNASGDKKQPADQIKVISENRKARFEYEVLDTLECGIMLQGSEVKSLRMGKVSLDEAYGRVKGNELWLVNCEIAEYNQATIWNHVPKRPRQLLVHKRELLKFAHKAKEKGLTLIPLKLYFNARGFAKVLMGLCRGKKLHDKRETMKKADVKRDIARAMRRR